MMKINSTQTDWIVFRNITSGNRITFDYNISTEPNNQWWVLYRGVMPDWANLNEHKEKWDWISSNSKTDRKGTVQFDYEFTPGAIYTLALFKDQTENAYDLADYFEFCVPPQDHKLSDPKISRNHITFSYVVDDNSSQGSGMISDNYKHQWWVLYRGVMPHWANLNKNKEKWDEAFVAPSRFDSNFLNGTEFDYEFTPGAIYTLALFKDQTENAYDLADYMEFCVQPQDDNLSNLKISGNTIAFDYNISAEPSYQWWVLYRGVMPDWAKLNENKEKWDWISSNSKTDRQGKVQFDYECTPGVIYTLALFKDQTENAYDLAYYFKFLGGEQDDNAERSGWIKLQGDNSYCYCACNSPANNKQKHDSNMPMNVKPGAPYLYAVLTKDDDSIDFPTGAVMTIEGPDGTKYDRDIEEEKQLVIMSGSSVRCLIVKDPKPGDWKMTMTVPEGVGFHCECNTVPSKDPYKTMTTTLSKTNQLQKRGKSDNDKTLAWYGLSAIWLFVKNEFTDIPTDAGAGALVGGAVGGAVGAAPGAVAGGIGGVLGGAIEGAVRGVIDTATQMAELAEANAENENAQTVGVVKPGIEDRGTAIFCEHTGWMESSDQKLEKRNPPDGCLTLRDLRIDRCWFDGAPHLRRLNNTDYGLVRIGLEEQPTASDTNLGPRPIVVEGVVMPVTVGNRDRTPQPRAGWNERWEGRDIDRGHLFALNLGGPDEPENIVPQWAHWQRLDDWRAMERTVRDRAVQAIDGSRPFGGGSPERSVFLRVEVIYPTTNRHTLRSWAFPSRFNVTAYVWDRETRNEIQGVPRIYDHEVFEGYPDNWSPG